MGYIGLGMLTVLAVTTLPSSLSIGRGARRLCNCTGRCRCTPVTTPRAKPKVPSAKKHFMTTIPERNPACPPAPKLGSQPSPSNPPHLSLYQPLQETLKELNFAR